MSKFDFEANVQIAEHAAKPKEARVGKLTSAIREMPIKKPRSDHHTALAIITSAQRILIVVAVVAVIGVCLASAFAIPRFDVKQLPPPQPHEAGLIV